MTHSRLDFLAAWGDELADALRELVPGEVVPQDAYEVFRRAFSVDPSPERLASLSASDIEVLRAACEEWLETRPIPGEAIRRAVAATLARRPPPSAPEE